MPGLANNRRLPQRAYLKAQWVVTLADGFDGGRVQRLLTEFVSSWPRRILMRLSDYCTYLVLRFGSEAR